MRRIDWINVVSWAVVLVGCLGFWWIVIRAAMRGLELAWQ